LSNQLDGTGIAPAVQLSESTEERKLLGHTLDITGALVRNNILKRSRSLEDLRKVIRDNSLFRPFPMRENYVEEEEVVNSSMDERRSSGLVGDSPSTVSVDFSKWSAETNFDQDPEKIKKSDTAGWKNCGACTN